MRLKSFYAKTMTEALHMIRETLGEDAIIVATREENGGKSVRVTAAVEQETFESHNDGWDEPATSTPQSRAQDGGWLQYDSEQDENAVAEELTDIMLKHAVPEEITDQVVSCATVAGMGNTHEALVAALEHLYVFRPLPQKAVGKNFVLVGPPGAGKTLGVAKMATRAVMAGQKVAVITTDTLRAGGVEQLAAFTKILNVPLEKARDPRDLGRAMDAVRGADQIVIDTGGLNPFNPQEMRDLARMMAVANMDPILVMPAGVDADESGEMARVYASLGVRTMISTRLDIARRIGGLLAAAHYGGLVFADASNTSQVAEGLFGMSPDRLARILMPRSAPADRGSTATTGSASPKKTVNAG